MALASAPTAAFMLVLSAALGLELSVLGSGHGSVRELNRDVVWVVSPDESAAVSAVIGKPRVHSQPNQPGAKSCGVGHNPPCLPSRMSTTTSDLAADWYKVLGAPPVVLSRPPTTAAEIGYSTGVVLFLGTTDKAAWLTTLFPEIVSGCVDLGWESHCIWTFPFLGNYTAVVATGNGDRGAIYAAYELSHTHLGVSPWYWFTGVEPAYRSRIPLPSLPLRTTIPPPKFKYRALFPNDEDLLSGFGADPLGASVFGTGVWTRFCEAGLRIKANTVQCGTVPYPDESATKLAARRGLVITSSHFNLLGSNTYRWPEEFGTAPFNGWDWENQPQAMAHMWRASIDALKDYEVLWSVGLRGVTDSAYAACGGVDATCADTMNHVVGNMTQWIHEAQGKDAELIWYLFGAASDYMAKGLLKVPDTKNFRFLAADNYPHIGHIDNLAQADLCGGLYYHTAWDSVFTNQLSEMLPMELAFAQIKEFMSKAKSTDVFILNLSDLLPVMFSTETILSFLWNPEPFTSATSPRAAQTAALQKWAAREFTGGDAVLAGKIATLENRYYALVQVPPDNRTHFCYGCFDANIYHTNTTVGDVWLGNLTRSLAWCAIDAVAAAPSDPLTACCNLGEGYVKGTSLRDVATQIATTPVLSLLRALLDDTRALAPDVLTAGGARGAQHFEASVELRHTMYYELWHSSSLMAHAILAATTPNVTASWQQTHTAGARGALAPIPRTAMNAVAASVLPQPLSPRGRSALVTAMLINATSSFEAIFAVQRRAEGTRWRGLYAHDKISNLHRSRRVLAQLQVVLENYLASAAASHAPLEPIPLERGGWEYQFYDYQLEHQSSFPLAHPSPRWNMYALVRVECAPGQSECRNLFDGGWFRGQAEVSMAAINQSCPIR